jgi:hypothetical protein
MYLDIAKLRKHGYKVEIRHDDDFGEPGDGRITGISIDGTEPPGEAVDALVENLKTAFPSLGNDTISSVAYQAFTKAQGMDIIRICSEV